jgi:hypothetical protein
MHCSRVDAFRHRAASIIADRSEVGHTYPRLTLIGPIPPKGGVSAIGFRKMGSQKACRATNVMRQGLCPIFKWARDAVKPLAANLAIISASP